MKKLTLVAGAVLALVSTTSALAQSSVTLYGIVDAAVTYTTKQTTTGGARTGIDAGQLATSRWGMRGTEDLGGGLKANFVLEGTLINDTGATGLGFGGNTNSTTVPGTVVGSAAGGSTSLFDRAATVGVSGGFGAITLGRQNILGVDSIGMADPIGLSQPGINPNVAFSALNSGVIANPAFNPNLAVSPTNQPVTSTYAQFGTNDGGAPLRQNNSIRYVTPVMSGFGAAVMYGFGEQPSTTNPNGNSSANSYAGISGFFSDGSSGVALAYAKLNNRLDNSKLTLWGGGAKYAVTSGLTLKATYAQNEVDTTNRKIAVIGAGVDFMAMPALTLTAAFYNTKRSGDLTGKANQYVGLAKYAMSKRTSMYTIFTHAKAGSSDPKDTTLGLITIPGESSANRIAVGMLHAF